MIYITADTHGKFRRILDFLGHGPITPQDLLIILGDAGFNYDAVEGSGLRRKAPVNYYGIPVLCLQGNHELRPEHIDSYREIPWHGGVVYQEPRYPNLLFAKDGEVYEIEGLMEMTSPTMEINRASSNSTPTKVSITSAKVFKPAWIRSFIFLTPSIIGSVPFGFSPTGGDIVWA